MKRISSRSRECAVAIGNQEPFNTYGALRAEKVGSGGRRSFSYIDSGELSGDDLDRWNWDAPTATYVVFSYDTPIAWVADGGIYKVKQKFSMTTSKHQGKLYLLV